ncbi:hypothetical protein M0R45_036955 [Rubus argutus]|uniref:RNase H type-1 domain-containing protein n=1 Tax=Rubus argutus TaxID=59490 RepID=A0AAW1W1I8_RUBAR
MLHLLRDCPRAKKVWNAIQVPLKVQGPFLLDWNGWIHGNILQQGSTWNHFNWKAANGTIGDGGFIWNSTGEWIHDFTHHISCGEILQAEVWGIFIGLKKDMELHIQKIEVQSDSVVAINLLCFQDYDLHPLATLLDNCQAIMRRFNFCSLQHVHREQNIVVDILEKDSISSTRGTLLFRNPPVHTIPAILDVIAGVTQARLMALNS